jgi:hypothetical protein
MLSREKNSWPVLLTTGRDFAQYAESILVTALRSTEDGDDQHGLERRRARLQKQSRAQAAGSARKSVARSTKMLRNYSRAPRFVFFAVERLGYARHCFVGLLCLRKADLNLHRRALI